MSVLLVTLSILDLFYIFSAFHGLLLALALFRNKRFGKQISNRIMGIIILFFTLTLLEYVSYSTGVFLDFPHLVLTTNPLLFSIAPLLYCYVESQTSTSFSLKTINWFYLFPGIIYFLFALPFYWGSPVVEMDFKINGFIKSHYQKEAKIGDPGTIHLDIINFVPHKLITLQSELTENFPEFAKSEAKNMFGITLFEAKEKIKRS